MAGENCYPCASCGSELDWKPGQGTLECPYCGHTEENPDASAMQAFVPTEHRMDQAALTATRGWGTETQEFKCTTCGALSDVEPHVTATACAFCGSDELNAQDSGDEVIRPESLVPFSVERDQAIGDFKGWISGLWFRPNALKKMARLNQIQGAYLPCWTYDAQTRSHWTAEAGHYYYVTETYTAQENGRSVQKTRQVRKTRWVPASGRHAKFFDDVLISASAGLEQNLFEGLEPYDYEGLRSYDTQYLAGFIAERYQLSLGDGYTTAQGKMDSDIRSECKSMIPGDTSRNLQVHTHYSDVTFKHVLLPVWIAAYEYQQKVYRYLVNGQTGKTHGTAPYSWAKITAAVLAVASAIGAIAALAHYYG